MSDRKLLEPHLTQKDGRFFITSVKMKQFVDENELLKIENGILLEELKRERGVVDFYAELNNWDYTIGEIDGSCITETDLEEWDVGGFKPSPTGGKLARETQKQRKVEI